MKIYDNCINIPIGTIFFICDPRTPKTNLLVIENAQEICNKVCEGLLQVMPEIEELEELKLCIVPITYNLTNLIDMDKTEALYSSTCRILSFCNYLKPYFVWRCPHANQAKFSGNKFYPDSCKDDVVVGATEVSYNNKKEFSGYFRDINLLIKHLTNKISKSFKALNGFENSDFLSYKTKNTKKLSPVEIKKEMLRSMWRGEMNVQQLIDYQPVQTPIVTIKNYDGKGTCLFSRNTSIIVRSYDFISPSLLTIELNNILDQEICNPTKYFLRDIDKKYYKEYIDDYCSYEKKLEGLQLEYTSCFKQSSNSASNLSQINKNTTTSSLDNKNKEELLIIFIKDVFGLAFKQNKTKKIRTTKGNLTEYVFEIYIDKLMTFLDYLIQEESDALNEYIGNRNPKDNGVIFPLVGYIFDKKLFQNKKMTKTDFAKVVKEESEKNKDSMKFSLGALSTINKLLSFKDSEDVNKEDNLIKAIARIIKQYKIN